MFRSFAILASLITLARDSFVFNVVFNELQNAELLDFSTKWIGEFQTPVGLCCRFSRCIFYTDAWHGRHGVMIVCETWKSSFTFDLC